jgi:hypothetical protein
MSRIACVASACHRTTSPLNHAQPFARHHTGNASPEGADRVAVVRLLAPRREELATYTVNRLRGPKVELSLLDSVDPPHSFLARCRSSSEFDRLPHCVAIATRSALVIAEIIASFVERLERRWPEGEADPKTLDFYRKIAARLLKHVGARTPVSHTNTQRIMKYDEERRREEMKATAHRRVVG